MALNDVTFIQYEGGLARTQTSEDHVSGLIIYSLELTETANTFPLVVFSFKEAVALGLNVAEPEYVIKQYFDANPQGELYIHAAADNTGVAATMVKELQRFAEGRIRQVGILFGSAGGVSASAVTALQTAVNELKADHMGLSILWENVFETVDTLAGLPSLTTCNAPNVSVLVTSNCLGAALGTLSASSVGENIGYVKKFNAAKAGDFQTLYFSTGEDYKAVTESQMSALKNKGYIFLRKYTGFAGAYFSDSTTATASTSDYAFIESVRTIEKAERSLRVVLLPELGAPLKTRGGKLAFETITKFELMVKNRLEQMQNADEISEFSVFIDPNQNVLSTSVLNIQVGITPLGVARNIVVGIGFEVKAN